jgi:hypothetical protein
MQYRFFSKAILKRFGIVFLIALIASGAQSQVRRRNKPANRTQAITTLNRQTALQLIKQLPTLSTPRYEIISLGSAVPLNENAIHWALQKTGVLSITKPPLNFDGQYEVKYTESGKEYAAEHWPVYPLSQDGARCVPYAHIKVLRVTGITESNYVGAGMEVDFAWQYVPADEKVKDWVYTGVQQSTANFKKYDDGWRIIQIQLPNVYN